MSSPYCAADCGCAGGQMAKDCTFEPSCPRCARPRQAHPVKTKIVQQAHEMSLDERRDLVIQDIIHDEDNFVEGTISWQLLEFFRWLQDNTDMFDPVVVDTILALERTDGGLLPKDALKFPEEDVKDLIRTYMTAAGQEAFVAARPAALDLT